MMNMNKYILCLLLLFASTAAIVADEHKTQIKIDDPKAAVSAVDTILRKYNEMKAVHDYVGNIANKFNRDPYVMTGIAKAYYNFYTQKGYIGYSYYTKDSVRAYQYIERALKVNSKYAPAYVRAGEIQVVMKDTAEAIKWFNRGIEANPKAPDCYIAHAKLILLNDSVEGIKKLEQIRLHNPDYPVYLEAARIYEDADKTRLALNNYAKTELSKMEVQDLSDYAYLLYFYDKDYKKAMEVANAGLAIAPYHQALNRWAFYCANADTTFVKEERRRMERFRDSCGIKEFTYRDYQQFAAVHARHNEIEQAEDMYMKAYEAWDADIKNHVVGTMRKDGPIIMEACMNVYTHAKIFDRAEQICNGYIERLKSENKSYVSQLQYLADDIYAVNAQDTAVTDTIFKKQLWQKFDSVYTVIAEVYPENKSMAMYYRLVAAEKIDQLNIVNDKFTSFCGLEVADEVINVLEMKNQYERADEMALVQAYFYRAHFVFRLGNVEYGYYIKSDVEQAIQDCESIFAISPGHKQAIILKKYLTPFKKIARKSKKSVFKTKEQKSVK